MSCGATTNGAMSVATPWPRSTDPCPLPLVAVPSGTSCDGPGTGETGWGTSGPSAVPAPNHWNSWPRERETGDDPDEGRAESAEAASDSENDSEPNAVLVRGASTPDPGVSRGDPTPGSPGVAEVTSSTGTRTGRAVLVTRPSVGVASEPIRSVPDSPTADPTVLTAVLAALPAGRAPAGGSTRPAVCRPADSASWKALPSGRERCGLRATTRSAVRAAVCSTIPSPSGATPVAVMAARAALAALSPLAASPEPVDAASAADPPKSSQPVRASPATTKERRSQARRAERSGRSYSCSLITPTLPAGRVLASDRSDLVATVCGHIGEDSVRHGFDSALLIPLLSNHAHSSNGSNERDGD
jgi:hypothetical protein